MSTAATAREIRRRLRNPPNAVPDRPAPPRPSREAAVAPASVPSAHRGKRRPPSPGDVTRVVCAHYGVTETELKGLRRERRLLRPRQVWAYLARTLIGLSYPQLGRTLGGRDHSTMLHACSTMQRLLETDAVAAGELAAVRRELELLQAARSRPHCVDPREI